MARITFIFFSIWFLILPFSAISSMYFSVAGLAVDKFIAPALMLIWLGLLLIGKYKLEKYKMLLLLYVFSFFVIRNISFMDNFTIFSELIWRDMILFGYFALPMLFVNNLKRVDFSARLISVNAVVACGSAFLVAMSIIVLPYERFSESRIGYEGIQKSIGVIGSYGDVTQLAAFFLILGLFMPNKLWPLSKKAQWHIKFTVLIIVIMGLIGNQSRSYLLSLVFAYVAVIFFSYRSKKQASSTFIDILSALAVVVLLPVIVFVVSDIVSMLSGMGGREAIGSATARLEQYKAAFSLIREYPLFGITSEFYIRNPDFAHGVHNLWLGQLTRGGIVATLLLIILLISILKKSIGLFRNSNIAGYAKVLTGYMVAVFISTLFYPADTDIFWALLGMCTSIVFTLSSSDIKVNNNNAVPNEDINYLSNQAENRVILKRSRKV